jgi:exosortase A
VVVALAGLAGLYWETLASMVAIWERSETFAHGYLIAPISAWLIWRRRDVLARVQPRPAHAVGLLIVLAGAGWLLARAVGLLVVEQIAFVAMIPLVLWALLGWRVVREILFPLAFLFFAVPMGEELIPPMMDFTAVFTVTMLRLTGIPVYVDGTFFTIPSGQWSVVEGCSGVRYLIASVTLGTLYAYLTYRGYWRRTIFIALSVIVPVFANGMRAYMIVMIAHLSDMRLALGVDHFIYGWVWFGIVMLILFWIGSYWRDDVEERPAPPPPESAPAQTAEPGSGELAGSGPTRGVGVGVAPLAPTGPSPRAFAWVLIVTLLAAGAAPSGHALVERGQPPVSQVALAVPAASAGWSATPGRLSDWEPRYVGMDATVHQTYRKDRRAVATYIAYYGGIQQGQELVNSQNVLVRQKHPTWRMPSQQAREVSLGGRSSTVLEATLRSEGRDLLVWRWNWIAGETTVSAVVGKLLQARERLLLHEPRSAGVVVYTPLEGAPEDERQVLQGFLDDMLPSIQAALGAARGGS